MFSDKVIIWSVKRLVGKKLVASPNLVTFYRLKNVVFSFQSLFTGDICKFPSVPKWQNPYWALNYPKLGIFCLFLTFTENYFVIKKKSKSVYKVGKNSR